MNMINVYTNRLNFIGGCVIFILLGSTFPLASAAVLQGSPLAIQALQTRSYDQYDKRQLFDASIMTLQDMGFIVERSDFNGGFISARGANGAMTVTIFQINDDTVRVRISGNLGANDISGYQGFFNGVDQNLFTAGY